MNLDWLFIHPFSVFWQNISIVATLLGTIVTILVWFRTRTLYKLYNSKAEETYIVEKLSYLYERYSEKIKSIKESHFKDNLQQKYFFWEIIKEANGKVLSFKNESSDINTHIQRFITATSTLANIQKDDLTYANVWEYYNHLTDLYQLVKSLEDINSRKVSK